MRDYSPTSAYQQSAAYGASPVGRVVSLYDTILRDFRRAQAAFDAGSVETRVFELNHALTVVAHLQNVLDHERGGEAARHFKHFYEVTRALIVELNASPSHKGFERLTALYGTLRQAWQEAEQKLPRTIQERHVNGAPVTVSSAPALPKLQGQPAVAAQDTADESPRGRWSA